MEEGRSQQELKRELEDALWWKADYQWGIEHYEQELSAAQKELSQPSLSEARQSELEKKVKDCEGRIQDYKKYLLGSEEEIKELQDALGQLTSASQKPDSSLQKETQKLTSSDSHLDDATREKMIREEESQLEEWKKSRQKDLESQKRQELDDVDSALTEEGKVVLCEDEKYPGVVVVKNQVFSEKISCVRQELDYREDMGISVLIPKDSVSPDESLDIVIQPSFSGSFEMPEDTEPASPAYLIEISKETELRKAIIVRMQHYANLKSDNDCKDMVFLRANSDPEYRGSNPVYVFKEVEGIEVKYSVDDAGYQVGEIALKQFSWWRIGKKKTEAKEIKKLYSARLYKSLEATKVTAVFCMCPYQMYYTQYCDDYIASHYTGMTCKAENCSTYNALKITSDKVTLVKGNKAKCIMDKSKISKAEIDLPEVISKKADKIPDYPPRIFITCTGGGAEEAELMTLRVTGLDEECNFEIPIPTTPTSPPPTVTHLEVNTQLLQKAKASLERKTWNTRSLKKSDLLISITMMISLMKEVERLVHDPSSMKLLVETVEQIQSQTDTIVRSTESTKNIEMEISKVITTSQQLKIGAMVKLKHCEDERDWLMAVDMLVGNAAELMSCIEEMLKVAEQDQLKSKKDDIPKSVDVHMSSLPACVRPFLEQQLDWDHGGVDRDLNAIAEHILDWEEKLSTPLELTRTEIHDIKFLYSNQPVLLRREVLRKWKEKKGLHCTYGNLLKVCCEGGDTHTAETICEVLRKKKEGGLGVINRPNGSQEEEMKTDLAISRS